MNGMSGDRSEKVSSSRVRPKCNNVSVLEMGIQFEE